MYAVRQKLPAQGLCVSPVATSGVEQILCVRWAGWLFVCVWHGRRCALPEPLMLYDVCKMPGLQENKVLPLQAARHCTQGAHQVLVSQGSLLCAALWGPAPAHLARRHV